MPPARIPSTYTTRPHRPRGLTLALRPVRVLAVILVAGQAAFPAPAAAQETSPLFESRDAWVAGAYLGATALALPLDGRVAAAARDSGFQTIPGLASTARAFNLLAVPGTLILSGGLYGIGRVGGFDDLADAGLHMGEAIVLAEVATYAIKFLAGRARPEVAVSAQDFRFGRGLTRGDAFRSFPSGHTSAAFAAAAVAAHEIRRVRGGNDYLVGFLTYGPAALVGAARVFDNQHWASDVVLGAAIGTFTGWKVVRYSHTHPDNRIDDWFLAGSVAPGDWSTLRLALIPRGW